MLERFTRFLSGEALRNKELGEEKFSVFRGIPVFGSDAISSVTYAGEELILTLFPVLGLAAYEKLIPISAAILCLLAILVLCYRQTIMAYPNGGGAYVVASENLGEKVSLLAGSSLIIDYILTVAVSASAGAAAVASVFPALLPYKPFVAFALICLLTWANLMGMRDSSAYFSIPTYLFILTMLIMIVTGFIRYAMGLYSPAQAVSVAENTAQLTGSTAVFLILRAFASGSSAISGVEAVSNGIPDFVAPEQKNAKRVLHLMALIVLVLFAGVTALLRLYRIVPDGEATMMSQLAAAVFGHGTVFFFLVQLFTVTILIQAANTAYQDLPLLLALIAERGFLPRLWADRDSAYNFATANLALALAATIFVFLFQGNQHLLIPLYIRGVFISFFLSQLGMCVHWRRKRGKRWVLKAVINGAGALVTGVTFLIIATSMSHGVWAVLLSIAILFVVMLLIKRHYESVRAELRVNDTDVETRLRKSPTAKVILPIGNMDRAFLKALNYALSFAQAEIELYHVIRPQEDQDAFRRHVASWNVPVSLVLEATEFRNYNQMVLRHVEHEVKKLPPGQMLTVILPQLNVRHWWQFVLHNQTSAQLSQWLGKNRNVSIIIIPFQI